MAFDAFLKIEGIEGDSSDDRHDKWIEVLSFSWGETNSGNVGPGGGGGVGKVQMQDFHFTMKSSTASPALLKSCATGEHIKEATLTCRKAGERQQDFMIVKMNDVLVSSYGLDGEAGPEGSDPGDAISLAFVKMDFVFKKTNEKGEVVG